MEVEFYHLYDLLLVISICLLTKLILKLKNLDMWPFNCCSNHSNSDAIMIVVPKNQDWPGNKELSEIFIQSLDWWDRIKVPHAINYDTKTVDWNQEGSKSCWKRRSPAMMAMLKKDLWKFFPSRSCETMIDWNFRDYDGNTGPMLAVIENDIECVRMLSKIEGIDWNRKNFGCWPRRGVHDHASIHDIPDEEKWCDIDFIYRESPLTWAVKRNFSEIVQILLSLPTLEISVFDFWSTRTCLHKIVKECKLFVSNMMERSCDDITLTPLIFALKKNLREDLITILIMGAKSTDIVDLVLCWKRSTEIET